MNTYKEKREAAIDAAMGKRDDVYPCREDIPSELWGEKIEGKTNVSQTNTNDYERGYSKGFLDGFQAARTDPSLIFPNVPTPSKNPNSIYRCPVCEIQMTGVWGYVCNKDGCPSKITATVTGSDYTPTGGSSGSNGGVR